MGRRVNAFVREWRAPMRLSLSAVAALCLLPVAAAEPAKPRNIEIIIDCSGSMEASTTRFTSFENKVEIAKSEVIRYVKSLPADTKLALRVFGTAREKGCDDSLLVSAMAPVDKAAVVAAIQPLKPAYHGRTPIALSLGHALADFQAIGAQGASNSIILITDGVESCGGNVNGAIEKIAKAGIDLKVNIVGFDVLDAEGGGSTAATLKQAAEATGGKAEFPKTQAELEQSLKTLAPPAGPTGAGTAPAAGAGLGAWLRGNVVIVFIGGAILLSAGTLLLLRGRGGREDDDA